MPERLFSIGEIAKLKGFTVKALRFYERIGLLKPHYVNPSTGYRYYSVRQFVNLDIIKAARALGIGPAKLKQAMAEKDTGRLLSFLKGQREEAERELHERRKTVRTLERVCGMLESSLAAAEKSDVYVREIPRRTAVTAEYRGMAGIEDAEMEYAKLEGIIDANHMRNTYEFGVLFGKNEKGEWVPRRIFNGVEAGAGADMPMLTEIPPGRYACVCCNGDNVEVQSKKMTDFIEANGFEPLSVLQVELLNDVFSTGSGLVEMQVLIG